MTREEMIEILIKDRIGDWVDARNSDGLEFILAHGWKGWDDYTDVELEECIEELCEDNFDNETAEKIKILKMEIELKWIEKVEHYFLYLIGKEKKKLTKEKEEIEKIEDFPF